MMHVKHTVWFTAKAWNENIYFYFRHWSTNSPSRTPDSVTSVSRAIGRKQTFRKTDQNLWSIISIETLNRFSKQLMVVRGSIWQKKKMGSDGKIRLDARTAPSYF